jgi:hypothetical protein
MMEFDDDLRFDFDEPSFTVDQADFDALPPARLPAGTPKDPIEQRVYSNANSALERMRRYYPHATCSWANADAIAEHYRNAARLTVATGVKWVVDHIVPLRSKLVSGLHNEHNLQVMTDAENRAKGCRLVDNAKP